MAGYNKWLLAGMEGGRFERITHRAIAAATAAIANAAIAIAAIAAGASPATAYVFLRRQR